MEDKLYIKYVALNELVKWIKNPKLHDLGSIIASIEQYGFRDSIIWDSKLNSGAGGVVAGNGRLESLQAMQSHEMAVPRGIEEKDGEWYVPVTFGVEALSEEEAIRFALDHNNLTMMGGNFTALDISTQYNKDYLELLVGLGDNLPVSVDAEDKKLLEEFLTAENNWWEDDGTPAENQELKKEFVKIIINDYQAYDIIISDLVEFVNEQGWDVKVVTS